MGNYKNALIKGFTVVELIIVIVLMGIIATVVFARYVSGSAFNPSGAQAAIITVAHAAQQASLGRGDVSFKINASGGEWNFSAVNAGDVLRSVSVSGNNVLLETGSATATNNTCANSFNTAVASDFELTYNGKGDLVDFTNNGTTETVDGSFNGARICVNDDIAFSVCISPAGYAYAGNCDD